jgi:hypothetical protein
MFFEKNALVPVVRWPEIANHFVDPNVVNCYSVMLGEQVVMTAPLQVGVTVNLLEASQPTHLLDEPITDYIGEDFKLARLYFRLISRLNNIDRIAMIEVLDDVTHSRSRDGVLVEFGYVYMKQLEYLFADIHISGWLNLRTGECKVSGSHGTNTMEDGIELVGYTLAANRVSQ